MDSDGNEQQPPPLEPPTPPELTAEQQQIAHDHEQRLAAFNCATHGPHGYDGCSECHYGLPLPPIDIEEENEPDIDIENSYYVPHMLGNLLYDIEEDPAFNGTPHMKRRRASSAPEPCTHSKTWRNMSNDRRCVMCDAVVTNTVRFNIDDPFTGI